MGALVMAHSDNNGLVLPPETCPDTGSHYIPIYKNSEQLSAINEIAVKIKNDLEQKGITVKYDNAKPRNQDGSLPNMN